MIDELQIDFCEQGRYIFSKAYSVHNLYGIMGPCEKY